MDIKGDSLINKGELFPSFLGERGGEMFPGVDGVGLSVDRFFGFPTLLETNLSWSERT